MKKNIISLLLLTFSMSTCLAFAATGELDFNNETYVRRLPDIKPQKFYTAQNDYVLKKPKKLSASAISLFYSPEIITVEEMAAGTDYAFKKQYSTVGRTFNSDDKYAISFLGRSGGRNLYSILKITYNDIYGINSSQLYVNLPKTHAKKPKQAIKTYDEKYFDAFLNLDANVYDKDNNILPQKTIFKYDGKEFVLKFARSKKSKDGSNYYLPENESLADYNAIIRLNYLSNLKNKKAGYVVETLEEDFIKNAGYKEMTKEIKDDEAIYSSIAFIVNNKDKSKPQEQVRYTLYKIKREKGVMKTFEYSFDFPKTADYLKKAQELDERLVKYAKNEEIPELVKKNFGVLPKAMSYSKSFYSVGVK